MPKSGEAEASLKIQGLSVEGRAQRLRLRLGKLEGVREVDLNYIQDVVSVKYDADKLTLDEIRDVVNGP